MKILTILGFGNVGASIAFGLLNAVENLHVNIIDPNKQLEGKFIDLQHAFVLYPKLKLSVNNTEVFQIQMLLSILQEFRTKHLNRD